MAKWLVVCSFEDLELIKSSSYIFKRCSVAVNVTAHISFRVMVNATAVTSIVFMWIPNHNAVATIYLIELNWYWLSNASICWNVHYLLRGRMKRNRMMLKFIKCNRKLQNALNSLIYYLLKPEPFDRCFMRNSQAHFIFTIFEVNTFHLWAISRQVITLRNDDWFINENVFSLLQNKMHWYQHQFSCRTESRYLLCASSIQIIHN